MKRSDHPAEVRHFLGQKTVIPFENNRLGHLQFSSRPAAHARLRWACTLALAVVLLTACAGAPPVVQEVKVPVYRSCVTAAPARPTFATRTLAPDASDGEKVLALARDHLAHFKYEGELEAVIAGCL